jgi:hypothetical protein
VSPLNLQDLPLAERRAAIGEGADDRPEAPAAIGEFLNSRDKLVTNDVRWPATWAREAPGLLAPTPAPDPLPAHGGRMQEVLDVSEA